MKPILVDPASIPPGLCHYELMQRLGVNSQIRMKVWAAEHHYQLTDGRAKYCGHHNAKHQTAEYIQALKDGAKTKTLAEVGRELGVTRERVRQLYNKHGIGREMQWGRHGARRMDIKDPVGARFIMENYQNWKTMKDVTTHAPWCVITVRKFLMRQGIYLTPLSMARAENKKLRLEGKKLCTTCGEIKLLDEFYSCGTYVYRYTCRRCLSNLHREWRERRESTKPKYPKLPFPDGYKRCGHCHKVKLADEFSRCNREKDRLNSRCKTCDREAQKKSYLKKKQAAMNQPNTKFCTKCKTVKPTTEFYKNRTNKDGLQGACKPCHNVQVARSHAKNPNYPYPGAKKIKGFPKKTLPVIINTPPKQETFGLTQEELNQLRQAL